MDGTEADLSEASARNSGIRVAVAALLAYVVAALVLTLGAWATPATAWAGICCDPEQTMWFLGWTPYALTHGLDPFFTTTIGAPAGVNLMWNADVPLLGLLGWLPAQLGGPIFAYNVLLVAAVALSGWTAFLVLRRIIGEVPGAFIGGAVFAFSPYLASHAALHLNLATAWVLPLFLLVLHELLVRRRRSPWILGIALGLLSVIQLLVAEEILATSVVAAAVLVVVMAISRRDEIGSGLRRLLPALAAATVTFLVVGAWPLAAQFLGAQRIVARVQDPNAFSTDLLNLVLPTPYQLIAPAVATDVSRHFSTLFHEATGYLGIPLLGLLAITAIVKRNDPRIRIATTVGLVLLILSFGGRLHVGATDTGIPLPWAPFSGLPLIEHALPGRLTLFVWLAVAAVVAVVIGDARRLEPRAAVPRLLGVAFALVFVLPAPLVHSSVEVPDFFRHWREQGISASDTVLVAPYFRNGAQAAPMVWAAFAGYELRMPEAYAYMPQPDGGTASGPAGTALTDVMQAIQRNGNVIVARGSVRAQIGADLRAAGIRHVIVGPMPRSAAMLGFFTDLFGRAPDEVEGVEIWRDVDVTGIGPVGPAGP
jgi:hypothetical protein